MTSLFKGNFLRADFLRACASAAILVAGLASSAPASAAPAMVSNVQAVAASSQLTDVRYRARTRSVRHHYVRRHRGGVGPGAVLGLFGAIAGAAIASNRYDDDYYGYPAYGYSQPNYGYGYYGPAYGYGYPGVRAYRGGYRGGRVAYRGAYTGGGFRGAGAMRGAGGGFRGAGAARGAGGGFRGAGGAGRAHAH